MNELAEVLSIINATFMLAGLFNLSRRWGFPWFAINLAPVVIFTVAGTAAWS